MGGLPWVGVGKKLPGRGVMLPSTCSRLGPQRGPRRQGGSVIAS